MNVTNSVRERVKRLIPASLKAQIIKVRANLQAPPLEQIVLHDYMVFYDPSEQPRLTLVMPTAEPAKAFGGVTSGLQIFFELARLTDFDCRVILDDYNPSPDTSVILDYASRSRIEVNRLSIEPRSETTPRTGVRRREVFVGFNWWTIHNLQALLREQARLFAMSKLPYLYIYQDFEPGFYPYSSTHMNAWSATAGFGEWWCICNSAQLTSFLKALGVTPNELFEFNPEMSPSLRRFLPVEQVKEKTILVYGRPDVPRNCFPAVVEGLARWASNYSPAREWRILSAGTAHDDVKLSNELTLRSVGKLSLEEYASLLSRTAVGLSLMASPHPSYPPLEMAHFGVRTITNTYSFKHPAQWHENLMSVESISPDALANALAACCDEFSRAPDLWRSRVSLLPSYLKSDNERTLRLIADKLRELSVAC